MATTEETIFAGLLDRVRTAPGSFQVAWPNVDFTPPAGAYLRVTQLPAPTIGLSLSNDGSNVYSGLLQVDLMWPTGNGLADAMAAVGAILSHFRRGVRLDRDGLRIDVTQAYSSAALREDVRLMVPITIRYRAFAPNL